IPPAQRRYFPRGSMSRKCLTMEIPKASPPKMTKPYTVNFESANKPPVSSTPSAERHVRGRNHQPYKATMKSDAQTLAIRSFDTTLPLKRNWGQKACKPAASSAIRDCPGSHSETK